MTTGRGSLLLGWVLAFSAAFVPQAYASSITDWDQWIENTNSDGSATFDGSTLIIIGPNDGSGLAGTADYLFSPTVSGVLQFHYYYSTYDPTPDMRDEPFFDYSGVLSDGEFVLFAEILASLATNVPQANPGTGALLGGGVMGPETGDLQFGTVQMPVVMGQIFGFRVGSEDNLFLPGILTISDLSFSDTLVATSVTPTPEPGTVPLILVAAGVGIVARRRLRRAS